MKWVTPVFLLGLLGWWGVTQAFPTLMMAENSAIASHGDPANVPYIWTARLLMVAMLVVCAILIKRSWARKKLEG